MLREIEVTSGDFGFEGPNENLTRDELDQSSHKHPKQRTKH